MRILVNDIAASSGGALTILRQFYQYVKDNCQDDEWIFLLADKYLEENDFIRVVTLPAIKQNHFRKVWFDCIGGKDFVQKMHPDVVLSMQNILTFGVKVPQAVYIHQSIPFQTIKDFSFFKHKERSIAFIQKIIGRFIFASVRKADAVFVQTKWMKEAVLKITGCPESKLMVVRPDMDPMPSLESVPSFSSHRFFYPTSNSLYKNNQLIVEACNILYERGEKDFLVELTLPEGTISHPAIRCVGYLDKGELFHHYAASVLLFPSYIETVGLPLLEAASVGSPIIATDTPHAREILQGYSNHILVPIFNASHLAVAMSNAMSKPFKISSPYASSLPVSEWNKVVARLHSLGRH